MSLMLKSELSSVGQTNDKMKKDLLVLELSAVDRELTI